MEKTYRYQAKAQWYAQGRAYAEAEHVVPLHIEFSSPPEFGGEPGVWTPEHFLMISVASCFVATFRAMATASHLEFRGIEASAEGVLEKESGGLRFTRIYVRPVAILLCEEDRDRAMRLLEKSEKHCLIARSLSAQVTLEPKLLVESPVGA